MLQLTNFKRKMESTGITQNLLSLLVSRFMAQSNSSDNEVQTGNRKKLTEVTEKLVHSTQDTF